MMYLITAYFDETTTDLFQKIINEASEVVENDFMIANEIPPHMTLLQFQTKSNTKEIIEAFKNLNVAEGIGGAEFHDAETQIPKVAYVPVEKTKGLVEINSMLFDAFSPFDETLVSRHYYPKNYYPHVSLAKRLDVLQQKKLLEFFKDKNMPRSGTISRIVLTEGKPPRVLCEKVFH